MRVARIITRVSRVPFRRCPLAFVSDMEATMEPVTVTVDGAKKALGIGTTKIYELIGEGKLATIKIGRRTLVKTDSIRQLVEAA